MAGPRPGLGTIPPGGGPRNIHEAPAAGPRPGLGTIPPGVGATRTSGYPRGTRGGAATRPRTIPRDPSRRYYGRRLVVVSADTVLRYGDAGPTCYLLYTGTHYDPLVGVVAGAEADSAAETREFPGGAGDAYEAAAVAIAENHRAKTAARAASERILRIRCCGGAVEGSPRPPRGWAIEGSPRPPRG